MTVFLFKDKHQNIYVFYLFPKQVHLDIVTLISELHFLSRYISRKSLVNRLIKVIFQDNNALRYTVLPSWNQIWHVDKVISIRRDFIRLDFIDTFWGLDPIMSSSYFKGGSWSVSSVGYTGGGDEGWRECWDLDRWKETLASGELRPGRWKWWNWRWMCCRRLRQFALKWQGTATERRTHILSLTAKILADSKI